MSEQFQNDNITVNMTRNPGSKVVLNITISPKSVDAAYKKAVKNINKEVSVPGFRKGKAPDAVIVKQFSQYIDQEWRDIVVNTAFSEALELSKIYPYTKEVIGQPQLKSLSREKGAEMIIQYEAMPVVPTIDVKAISINHIEKKKVTDKQIEDAIEDICYQHATWTDVTDRPAAEGDYVELDIDNIEGEEPESLFKHTRFKVDKKDMGKWMYKLIVGHNTGDSVEGMSEHEPKEGEEKNEDFKSTKLRITINKILTATFPELNEEFAKKLGLKGIDEIKEKVTSELDRYAEEEQKDAMRNELGDYLVRNYHVDLPSSMVDADIKRTSNQAIARVRAAAKKGEDISQKAQQAAAEAATKLENSYRLFFLLRKVADDNNITIDSQEIMHELMRQMFAVPANERIIDIQGDPNESRSRIFAYLLERKAKDWLLENASLAQEKA